jgi:hypothetical protein
MTKVVTHRDDYHNEILPKDVTSHPDKPGQVMPVKRQI